MVAASLAPAAARAATAEASARTTLFDEPGGGNEGVRVLHPQVDASATFAETLSIALGYNVDIVTDDGPGRGVGPDQVP
jgi:hypothetical protein